MLAYCSTVTLNLKAAFLNALSTISNDGNRLCLIKPTGADGRVTSLREGARLNNVIMRQRSTVSDHYRSARGPLIE